MLNYGILFQVSALFKFIVIIYIFYLLYHRMPVKYLVFAAAFKLNAQRMKHKSIG